MCLVELINSGQYNTGNDFTVVLQPFFTEILLPIGPSGYADLSTLAVYCFHFSPSGGRVTAVNLWNNMFQDVGGHIQHRAGGAQIPPSFIEGTAQYTL